jgi:hypothetical protein
MRQLIVAALFHDFDHSGGVETDDVNIDRAVCAFIGRLDFSRHFKYNVIKFIENTQYPFIHTPVSIEQKILRDADLMMITYPNWFYQVMWGLLQEAQHKTPELTIETVIKKQIDFIKSIRMFTEWGVDLTHRSRYTTINYLEWLMEGK